MSNVTIEIYNYRGKTDIGLSCQKHYHWGDKICKTASGSYLECNKYKDINDQCFNSLKYYTMADKDPFVFECIEKVLKGFNEVDVVIKYDANTTGRVGDPYIFNSTIEVNNIKCCFLKKSYNDKTHIISTLSNEHLNLINHSEHFNFITEEEFDEKLHRVHDKDFKKSIIKNRRFFDNSDELISYLKQGV